MGGDQRKGWLRALQAGDQVNVRLPWGATRVAPVTAIGPLGTIAAAGVVFDPKGRGPGGATRIQFQVTT